MCELIYERNHFFNVLTRCFDNFSMRETFDCPYCLRGDSTSYTYPVFMRKNPKRADSKDVVKTLTRHVKNSPGSVLALFSTEKAVEGAGRGAEMLSACEFARFLRATGQLPKDIDMVICHSASDKEALIPKLRRLDVPWVQIGADESRFEDPFCIFGEEPVVLGSSLEGSYGGVGVTVCRSTQGKIDALSRALLEFVGVMALADILYSEYGVDTGGVVDDSLVKLVTPFEELVSFLYGEECSMAEHVSLLDDDPWWDGMDRMLYLVSDTGLVRQDGKMFSLSALDESFTARSIVAFMAWSDVLSDSPATRELFRSMYGWLAGDGCLPKDLLSELGEKSGAVAKMNAIKNGVPAADVFAGIGEPKRDSLLWDCLDLLDEKELS